MISKLPEWIVNVPLKTVGVLCATHIFGKNIESRQIVLAGKRYLHNAVENVVGYVLNPILPPLNLAIDDPGSASPDALRALKNIRDCFNFIFHIQIEYFKVLHRLCPERFKSKSSGIEINLNQFMAKGPTLINSEKRYLLLSKIDGAQPYDLNLNWNADFDWVEDAIRLRFHDHLLLAQEAYADTLHLGRWYNNRERNLIIPLRIIMDDLSEYFHNLGLAAYYMARKFHRRSDETVALIKSSLLKTCRHLERFTLDMQRVNVFSIVKHDVERLHPDSVDAVVRVRATDDANIDNLAFESLHDQYADILSRLYQAIGFESESLSLAESRRDA